MASGGHCDDTFQILAGLAGSLVFVQHCDCLQPTWHKAHASGTAAPSDCRGCQGEIFTLKDSRPPWMKPFCGDRSFCIRREPSTTILAARSLACRLTQACTITWISFPSSIPAPASILSCHLFPQLLICSCSTLVLRTNLLTALSGFLPNQFREQIFWVCLKNCKQLLDWNLQAGFQGEARALP